MLDNLNKSQKEAVLSNAKRLLILAGAGSGKTTVLTLKIQELINNNQAPNRIMAITFTNKAAKEIKDRIAKISGDKVAGMVVTGTFHSICVRILRKLIDNYVTDYTDKFTILDSEDTTKIAKDIANKLVDEGIIPKSEKLNDKMYYKRYLSTLFDLKDEGFVYHDNLIKETQVLEEKFNFYGLSNFAENYEKYKINSNCLDFGDLISYVVYILKNNKNIREKYENALDYIMVDEFQDTNKVQFELVTILSKKNSLAVVGDDDQSIYGWRGAIIENILNFENHFNDVHVVKLQDNYRSTSNILNLSNSIIEKNKNRFDKKLLSNNEEGELVKITECTTPDEEGKYIAQEINKKIREGVNLNEIAVLYRSSFVSRTIESGLTNLGIPYKVIGGLKFWERKEIKDIMAYLNLAINSQNNISFERVINLPSRGIGPKKIEDIKEISKNKSITSYLETVIDMLDSGKLKGKAGNEVKNFVNIIIDANAMLKENKPITSVISFIIKETDILNLVYKKDQDRFEDIQGNLASLIEYFSNEEKKNISVEKIELLNQILENISLASSIDDEASEQISLMTVHASKGLEFDSIFIAGAEDGTFPSERSLDQGNIEEERRLMYVATTRAKKHLNITYCDERYFNPKDKSTFLFDINEETVEYNKFGIKSFGGNRSFHNNSFF